MITPDTTTRTSITKVSVRNFRSIQAAELELGPLTVLVGPNASGKSNLLDVLGFLGDIARYGLDSSITRRGGIDSIGRRNSSGGVSGTRGDTSVSLIQFCNGIWVLAGKKRTWRVSNKKGVCSARSLETGELLSEVEITNGHLSKPNLNRMKPRISPGDSPEDDHHEWLPGITRQLESISGDQDLLLITSDPARISILVAIVMSRFSEDEERPFFDLDRNLDLLKDQLSRFQLYHIFPNSLREPQKVADSHPLGESGENLASTLKEMIRRGNQFLPDLKEALNFAVPGTVDIRVSSAGSYYVVELNQCERQHV